MATESLFIKCQNEDCQRMGLYKTFNVRSDGSRGEQTSYDYNTDDEWANNGGNSRWRCPSCGSAADLTRA